MKTLNLKISDKLYREIEILSKEKGKNPEEIAVELLSQAIEEDILLKKAKKIIEEEKDLLKKLA
ncbi:hypothetical protein [Persephonella sp. KM09-Lau-8]|uniref:hypothetical protein n=1 Tax=Persephonella sp. KM09-Lau-8 TaxID=1158345 RepID=UPI00049853EF|nr:hypothetical protein [Persephonella sp. KM09-Lau-8]